MKRSAMIALAAIALLAAGHAAGAAEPAKSPALDPMPPALETQFALSALPPELRDTASVYLLDPAKGYYLARQGSGQFSCLITRTYWFKADFRNDIFDPSCFDREGLENNLKVWMDTARMRAEGQSPQLVRQSIARRFAEKTYRAPTRFGLSYMLSPLMRTYPDTTDDANHDVMTMSGPHVMYYAPGVTNAEIGSAGPNPTLPWVLLPGPHGYVIQPVGKVETANIVADNKALLDALCAYRDVLCLMPGDH